MTLTKLARLANVSVSTASKAFSMSSEVNEETREMIFKVAKENNCFKKFFNAKYPKLVVAVICPELQGSYYSDVFKHLQAELSKVNCEVCVSTTNFQDEKLCDIVSYYEKYTSVDAMIIVDRNFNRELVNEIPVICLDCAKCADADTKIFIDYKQTMEQIVDLLINSGAENIGFIGEKLTVKKKEMFIKVLESKRKCVDENLIITTEERFENSGYVALKKMIDLNNLPDAVVCAYDNIAYGVLRCAKDYGINVPGDLMVVGMNNLEESAYFSPSLSSVDMSVKERAEIAVKALCDLIQGKSVPEEIAVNAKLIERETTNKKIQS